MRIKSLIQQEWSILGDPGAVSRVGRKGGTYLKTFVPSFLPTRLTAPGSPRMGVERSFQYRLHPLYLSNAFNS